MLSYLHAYHAGNAADVLKHSALIFCLNYLKNKEKALLCVDTHAGAGMYMPGAGENTQPENTEWQKGLGLLLAQTQGTGPIPGMAADYITFCTAQQPAYSGSPLIMAKHLEKGDRVVCFELHPGEFASLSGIMSDFRGAPIKGKPGIEVRREDGLCGLRSLLPPPLGRALVLIDPSWEDADEIDDVSVALQDSLKRFPQGVYIIWYPLLRRPKEKGVSVRDTLFGVTQGKRCRLELYTASEENKTAHTDAAQHSPRGMYGSGLVIINPPWTLRSALEDTMPWFAEILGGESGGWKLEWEA